MSEPVLLFPFLDVAMRAVAILILCALPLLLMPEPRHRTDRPRNVTRRSNFTEQKSAMIVTQSD